MKARQGVVIRLLQRRFGAVPADMADAIAGLTLERLDNLTDALLDFKTITDAQAWIAGV